MSMGNLLKTVGSEIYWVTGTGSLTIDELKLFESKLDDAKRKQGAINEGKDKQGTLSKIYITHPSPNRKQARTTKE
jgi:hypothetical protein